MHRYESVSASPEISVLYPESICSLQHMNKTQNTNYFSRARFLDHICLSHLKCEGFFFVMAFGCIMFYHGIYFSCYNPLLVEDYHIIPLDFHNTIYSWLFLLASVIFVISVVLALLEQMSLHLFHSLHQKLIQKEPKRYAYMFMQHKYPANHICNRDKIFKKLPYDNMLIKNSFTGLKLYKISSPQAWQSKKVY